MQPPFPQTSRYSRLSTLTPDPPSQLDILGHDCNTLGMDGTEIGVLKQTHEVCLSCLLESQHSMALETQISLKTKKKKWPITKYPSLIINTQLNKNPKVVTLKSWAISRTSLWKGNFLIRSSVLFWYLRISLQTRILRNQN